jgi:enoyl-CoA hydratase
VADPIEIREENRIAVVTLNRPDRLNAMSFALVRQFHAILDDLERSTTCDVVVLTGAGRAFCSGIDLKEGLDSWPGEAERTHGRYRVQQEYGRLVTRMRAIPQPLIAAVHGPACGGGLSLAAACDIRVADETAQFNVAFVTIGLTGADMGLSWVLPRTIGLSAAAELMYTGRFFGAAEAHRLGFVSQVVAPGDDFMQAMALAAEITANTGFGVRLTKEILNHSMAAPSLDHMVALENRSQVLAASTKGFQQALDSFASRRARPSAESEPHS